MLATRDKRAHACARYLSVLHTLALCKHHMSYDISSYRHIENYELKVTMWELVDLPNFRWVGQCIMWIPPRWWEKLWP